MTDTPTTTLTYTVYYRRRDGAGTRTWDSGLSLSEATAQQTWCFRNSGADASMVWVLASDGAMVGEPFMREIEATAEEPPANAK